MSLVRHAALWLGVSLLFGMAYCPPLYAVPFSFVATVTGSSNSATGDEVGPFTSFFNASGSGTSNPFGAMSFTTSGSANVNDTQTAITGGSATLALTFAAGDSLGATGSLPAVSFSDTAFSFGTSINSGTGTFSGATGTLGVTFQATGVLQGNGDVSAPGLTVPTGPGPGAPVSTGVSDIQTIDGARAFVTSKTAVDLARLTRATYGGSDAGPGYPALTSTWQINNPDGLVIRAYKSPDGNIVVSIRGTEGPSNPSAFWQNWYANEGFIGRSPKMSQYLDEAAKYVLALEKAIQSGNFGVDAKAKIVFTGHSLGGGIAQILGNATGFDAIAFNGPGVTTAIPLYGAELLDLRKFNNGRLKPDNSNLLNVANQGDPLTSSGVGGPAGKVIQVKTDAFGSLNFATREVQSQFQQRGTIELSVTYNHSIGTVIKQMTNDVSVLSYKDLGNPSKDSKDSLFDVPFAPEAIKQQILQPTAKADFRRPSIQGDVPIVVDPLIASAYIFHSKIGSPKFAFFALPEFISSQRPYKVAVLENGQWRFLAFVNPLTEFFFPEIGGVSDFRVSDIDDLNLDPTDPLLVELGFASDGDFTGGIDTISATPEPATLLLWGSTMAGLGLAARWKQRRRKLQP